MNAVTLLRLLTLKFPVTGKRHSLTWNQETGNLEGHVWYMDKQFPIIFDASDEYEDENDLVNAIETKLTAPC